MSGWHGRSTVVVVALAAAVLGGTPAGPGTGPVAASPAGFTVGVVGDHSSGPAAAEVLRAIGADAPDFFLSLGDLGVDPPSAAAWCQFVKDNLNAGAGLPAGSAWGETYPFEVTVGNHDATTISDYVTPTCLPDRLGAVAAPFGSYGRAYYLDYPPAQPLARFIVTDPAISAQYTEGSPQLAWVARTIDDARAAGIPWVVAANHENYISSGIKTNEIGSDFFNLLVAKRVDLILEGHDHTYQRSKQLAHGAGCALVTTGAANNACLADDGADGGYAAGAGSVLLIEATGGQGTYPVDPADPEAAYFAVANGAQNETRGFTRLTITGDALTARFVRSGGASFADSFEIARVPDTSPPTAPGSLTARAASGSRIDLAWSAASDDRGIAGYRITRDGVDVPGTVTGQSAAVTGLTPGTTYTFAVRAVDFAGNVGPPSPAAAATTYPSDATVYVDGWDGPDGAAWQPSAWATDSNQGAVDVSSGAGRLLFTDRSGAWARAALTGVRAVTDTDVVLSYAWQATGPLAYLNVYLRGTGGWQNSWRPRNGYGVQFASNSRTAAVARNVNGAVTTLRTVSAAQALTTSRQWLHVQVIGDTFRFRTWLDGQPEPTTWATTLTDAALPGGGQLYVSLNRSSSNVGAKGVDLDDLVLTDAAPVVDTEPPTAPAALRATAVSASTVSLAWDAAHDNVAVTGYHISRDGTRIGSVDAATLAFSDAGLAPSTTYRYEVVALDAVPNESAAAALVITTDAAGSMLFGDTWSAPDGSTWAQEWAAITAQGLVDVRDSSGRLGISGSTLPSARAALTGIPAVADSDLLFSYRWSSAAPRAYLNLYLRGTGGWQNSWRPRTGYGVQLQNDSGTVLLQRNVNGGVTTLRSVGQAAQVGTARQWLRLRVVGSTIQLRIWPDGAPEPAGWTASVTDTAVAAPGQLYVSLNRSGTNTGDKDVYLDDLVLGDAR